MSFKKVMKGIPIEFMAAKGLTGHDYDAVTLCQRECMTRTSMTIQLEQEAYLSQHPEIFAMLELFISDQTKKMKNQVNVVKEAAEFFLRPLDELDNDIRKRLGVGPNDPYMKVNNKTFLINDKERLYNDLLAIAAKHHPPKPWSISTPSESLNITKSSSFISAMTSDTTLPTPEPEPIPEPTLSEYFMTIISNTVDKVIYTRFDDQAVLYDSAYVAVSKAVELAMEIPVVEIKEDIAELFLNAYNMYELIIDEKRRIAAEMAWEKRMRKKMKRTLRRQKNFKGYETPPSSDASVSSHESYRHAPPRPCICHPQWHYNRLPKDRFGIYLPRKEQFPADNVTVTPVLSVESTLSEQTVEEEEDRIRDIDTMSVASKMSKVSKVSKISKTSKKGA